uniref:Uncharacterized protein n=1 Tax=Anguilla anguilla TaxID=7936 RepID=A0A0E9ST06_ANGAN
MLSVPKHIKMRTSQTCFGTPRYKTWNYCRQNIGHCKIVYRDRKC